MSSFSSLNGPRFTVGSQVAAGITKAQILPYSKSLHGGLSILNGPVQLGVAPLASPPLGTLYVGQNPVSSGPLSLSGVYIKHPLIGADITSSGIGFKVVAPKNNIKGSVYLVGLLNVTGNVSVLGNVSVTGTVGCASISTVNGGGGTISGTLTAAVLVSNGAMNSASASVSGALSAASASVTGNVTAAKFIGNLQGNADTATALRYGRNIGGIYFDGSSNIDLPGVNTTSNQDTTGNAATATKLATARTIGGVSFDGSANINLAGVNTTGNQNTTGSAALNVLKAGDTMTGTLKIDNSSLLVGILTARTDINGVEPSIQIEGTTASGRQMSIISSSSSNSNAQLILGAQRSGNVGGAQTISDNANLGALTFVGYAGDSFEVASRVEGEIDAGYGIGAGSTLNICPGRIVFSTQPARNNDDYGPTDSRGLLARFRIAHDGGMRFWQDINNTQRYWFKTEDTNNSSEKFIRCSYGATNLADGGTEFFNIMADGTIKTDGSTTIQPLSSERRVKQNIESFDPDYAWETVKSIIPRKFELKSNPGNQRYGYIVDELPEEFHLPGSQVDEEGPIRTYDAGHVEYMYRVALKKALERIESLESRLALLESQ